MKKIITSGDEAVVDAAIMANANFFAGYPITPASEVMHAAAKNKKLEFIHAEDEIASAHMIIGASLAGAKAFTATSGPGFSLMQEAIGLGHMAEVPIVIVDVQRVGPSTGMPTLPSQGDIMQSRYGSHGDYFPIVLYPNSIGEIYKYTIEAFNAAEESLSPVILMIDGFLGHLYETVDLDKIKFELKNRDRKPLGTGKRHFTGLIAEEGIPKTKDTDYYRAWIKRIKKKMDDVSERYNFYEYIENKDSDTLLIAYGITSRVIAPLKEKYSIFRPIRMFPVLEKEIKETAKKYKKIVVIEMNTGQYKNEIERVIGRKVHAISELGGEINLSEIKKELEK